MRACLAACMWPTPDIVSFTSLMFFDFISDVLESTEFRIRVKIWVCRFYNVWFILYVCRPDLIRFDKLQRSNAMHNLDTAFCTAEEQLGLTKLLDPEGTFGSDLLCLSFHVMTIYWKELSKKYMKFLEESAWFQPSSKVRNNLRLDVQGSISVAGRLQFCQNVIMIPWVTQQHLSYYAHMFTSRKLYYPLHVNGEWGFYYMNKPLKMVKL